MQVRCKNALLPLFTFLHIAALLYGRDGGGVRGRTTDAQLLQLAHKAGFSVAGWMLREAFRSNNVLVL